ncbi:MAG: FAD-dependent oxidoreductase [Bacillota bacterium]|nr:FAD-dependent oxidoreductase [Bacillota bacterium]
MGERLDLARHPNTGRKRGIKATRSDPVEQVKGRSEGEPVVVIGAGSTGAALAYDLALRGLPVLVLERGEPGSGTTGRNHALLHSGARYVVSDPESARECAVENRILRRIAPEVVERNGGLFIALDEEDLAYRPRFLEAAEAAGVPAREITPEQALALEPELNPGLKAAVQVEDAAMDPYRLVLAWLASAEAYGAVVRPYSEVTGVRVEAGRVRGLEVHDLRSGRLYFQPAALVVNAAGPWAGRVAALAGVRVPVVPSPGVMVATAVRLNRRVVNRLRRPGDGDIIVPQRQASLIGTTSWTVEEPDLLEVPPEHVALLIEQGAQLIPAVRGAPLRAAFVAARPLVAGNVEESGREISRTFQTFDHESRDGVRGLITIAGGKTTTSRAMAEAAADLVCRRLGFEAPCRTAELPLRSYRLYRPAPPVESGRSHRPEGRPGPGVRPRSAAALAGPLPAPASRGARPYPVRLRLRRSPRLGGGGGEGEKGDEGRARFEEVSVEDASGETLLDLLERLRFGPVPDLVYRASCHHANCGSCAVEANGVERLACVARVEDLVPPGGLLTLEPLGSLPWVADLVADLSPLRARLAGLEAPPKAVLEGPGGGDAGEPGGERFPDCIECGACLAACPVVASDPAYLGPAPLAAALRAVGQAATPAEAAARLAAVDGPEGVWRCHQAFECSEVCPAHVDPAGAILALRRLSARRHLGLGARLEPRAPEPLLAEEGGRGGGGPAERRSRP